MWFFRSIMLNRNTKNYVYILMFHDYLNVYVLFSNMYVYSCVFNSAACLFIMVVFFPAQNICL